MAQSYSNPGGSGNRAGIITVTTTGNFTGAVSLLVDGVTAAVTSMWFNSGNSGVEVKFTFAAPRLITEAKWYQSAIAAHGDWQWQGSPDNSAWTNIGSTFTLGTAATQTITTLSGNATAYRYYRMLQTTGTASTSPYLYEVEFSIDDGAVITDARVTQALAEHWLTTNPDARITQVAAEHWASVASGNLQAVVTQVLLEHWASVAVVVPASGGPMVTMIH
jgi:hypothetical protein